MLYDSHNHLQDSRLDPWRAQILAELPALGVAEAVVNGTRESDWPAVASLAHDHPWVRPSFGLHPWQVKARSPDWLHLLQDHLRAHPQAAVGEIGLDRWITDPDLPAQVTCFRAQMALATELKRPVTIHCLRAWGLLEEELRHQAPSPRGFLLHSYSGPADWVPALVRQGAYFSLSPYFGHERKVAQLATFRSIPLDRLLAETDAPDMRPPDTLNSHPLTHNDQPLNHPANLTVSYDLLAKVHGLPLGEIIARIGENHRRLFG